MKGEEVYCNLDKRQENSDPARFYELGQKWTNHLKDRFTKPYFVTGGDSRADTAELLDALESGIVSEGGSVLSIGMDMPKPIAYVGGKLFGANAIGYVTASHIRATFNGIKFNPMRERTLLPIVGGSKVDIQDQAVSEYRNYLSGKFGDIGENRYIVVDSLYGSSSGLAKEIIESLGFRAIGLHDYHDRDFSRLPNNAPDPHDAENLEDAMHVCRRMGLGGVAFDGDMDRVSVLTENGEKISEDQITMIVAKYLLGKNPKGKVIYEIKSTNAVPEVIKDAGGRPIMERTGWRNIKKRLQDEKAIFAGEISGHYFYGKGQYYVDGCDDGLFSAMIVADAVANLGGSLDQICRSFPRYHTSPEIRVEYSAKRNPQVLEEIAKRFESQGASIKKLGADLKIEQGTGPEWRSWAVVRQSSNVPSVLTIRYEGKTEEELEEMKKRFEENIPEQDGELKEKMVSGIKEGF